MCKKCLPSSAYLDEAAEWSRDLVRMRSRGPGDVENAMRSLERDYGVDYWVIWRLRYRRSALKDIGVAVYMGLKAAHRAECEKQMRRLGALIGASHEYRSEGTSTDAD